MKAVILVGGEATRLRPLTYNTPKAMVPVLNIPFLEHVFRYLSSHQVKDIILAQSHLAQPIKSYFGNGNQFGVKLIYIVEETPRGTAGAVKNAARYLDETFLVLNGDIFTDLDITAMIDFHRESKAKATIALTPVDDPTSYGLIETNAQGRVTRFLEKPKWSQVTTNMINAGTYVLEPEALSYIPPQANVSIEREVFPKLVEEGKPVYAYPSPAYWIDIGTPEKYLRLHRDLLSGKSSQYPLAPDAEVLIREQSSIHPTAQIRGAAVIGSNCSIGPRVKLRGPVVIGTGCTILEDTVIEESIIWQNARVGQHVNLKGSIVADNCHLNNDSVIEDSILADNVTVASGIKLEPGSRILPQTTVEADQTLDEVAVEPEEEASTVVIRELLRRTDQEILRHLVGMSPSEFEQLVGALFRRMGFQVLVTKATRDGGIDIIASYGKLKAIAQCKRSQGVVGVQVVRDLYGTMVHDNAHLAFLITTGTFSQDARNWAMGKALYLKDCIGLLKWIREYVKPRD